MTIELPTDVRSAVVCSDLLCHVRMFKPQFAPLVLSGEKCQTIRPTPKRMPKSGERISLRQWTGKPYRSKQRVLRESIVAEVLPVKINAAAIMVNGCVLLGDEEWAFAKADGFNTPQDLLDWFNFTHGLPFEGVVIKWHNDQAQRLAENNQRRGHGNT